MQKLPVMLYHIKKCCSNVIGPPGHHVVTRSHSTSVVTVSHTCPMSGYSSAASGNITAPLPAHGPTLIILHTPAAHCIKHLPAGLLHHAANTIKYFSKIITNILLQVHGTQPLFTYDTLRQRDPYSRLDSDASSMGQSLSPSQQVASYLDNYNRNLVFLKNFIILYKK